MYKKYSKRLKKDFCNRKIFWHHCVYLTTYLFFKLFYSLEIQGRKNVPKKEKFICAANHISYFDPFLVAFAVFKPVAYMAKKELFEKNVVASTILDELAAFAVNRESLDIATIRTVKEVFKTKYWNLGIFPQGGIRRNHKIEKINKGVAVIAKSAKCDILPVSVTGCEEYNWNPFTRKKVVIKIGTLISYEKPVDEILHLWASQVAEMSGYEYVRNTENIKEKDLMLV